MKANELMTKVENSVKTVGRKLEKRRPEIYIALGISGVVVGTVWACVASTKVNEVLTEAKEKVETVHKECDDLKEKEEYVDGTQEKKLAAVYAQTGLAFVKLYGPAVTIELLSIACIVLSHKEMKERNVALGAAYTSIAASFKEYRDRVKEQYGEEAETMIRYNMKKETVEEKETDPETGKQKKVKKDVLSVDNVAGVSDYARIFYKYATDEKGNSVLNPYWEPNNDYNLMFLRSQERYLNDLLRSKGRVFLNDVYRAIGIPETKAGQIVGWVYNKGNDKGDNYISFGLKWENCGFIGENGFDSAILLDFNVDGNIWELM